MVRGTLWFFLLVIMAGLMGGCVGCAAGFDPYWRPPPRVQADQVLPLPHHFSKYPDGLSLRFAMVHDMIHERFPKHGPAYYEERNRVVQKELADPQGPAQGSQRYFDLLDDLGAGLERLGKHEEAVALMRRKLTEQQAAGLTGKALYSSYANLGTFLILWQLQEGFADKAQARARLQEGLDLVHQSIKVNPEAHFGREIWQAVILEFLIAALDRPELILQYDFIGDRLDAEIDPRTRRSFEPNSGWQLQARFANQMLKHDPQAKERLRSVITKVGAETDWSLAVKSSQPLPVPFDEPTLGIIGMWRLGSGANPYFALALGEIMLRVGQRYIAWTAYERAAQLAGGIWPDPQIQQGILAHCRRRQQAIEEQLPADEKAQLRPRFEKELAFGQRYQRAYQAYEAEQIAQGVSIDDPKFYAGFDFEARNQPIASPIGPEDQYVSQREFPWDWRNAPHAVLFFAGLFAFAAAGLMRLCGCCLNSSAPPAGEPADPPGAMSAE